MAKILITGGAGFIGGNFIHYMMEKYSHYDFYNVDLLTYAGDLSKHQKIENQSNYHFIKADIADRQVITTLFQKHKFDYVVHFAAESHVDRSIHSPEKFILTNVLGTQVLLEAARQINIKKFIHISTDEVYGDLEMKAQMKFNENSLLQPNNPYSASKASADLLVRAYSKTYNLPVNITRCSNNYGSYHFPEKLIPLTITHALNNMKVPIYGNGSHIRDWLHVKDHCSAIDLVMHQGLDGEVYNVGSNNEQTNLDVVRFVIGALGKSESIIEFVQDRKGHDKRYAIDAEKLNALGWNPFYSFDTGLSQTVQWYLDNKKWWEKFLITDKGVFRKINYSK